MHATGGLWAVTRGTVRAFVPGSARHVLQGFAVGPGDGNGNLAGTGPAALDDIYCGGWMGFVEASPGDRAANGRERAQRPWRHTQRANEPGAGPTPDYCSMRTTCPSFGKMPKFET